MAKKNTKPQNNGELPKHVVNQLVEHTVGGFMLFYFNQETGEPDKILSFDSPAHCLALQKYISDWQQAINQVNMDIAINAIHEDISSSNPNQTGKLNNEEDDDDED